VDNLSCSPAHLCPGAIPAIDEVALRIRDVGQVTDRHDARHDGLLVDAQGLGPDLRVGLQHHARRRRLETGMRG